MSLSICGPKFTESFFTEVPTRLHTHFNKLGQEINFYEHPYKGDSVPVYATICGCLFNTGFFDVESMISEHGEYTPLLIDGVILFGSEA